MSIRSNNISSEKFSLRDQEIVDVRAVIAKKAEQRRKEEQQRKKQKRERLLKKIFFWRG